MRIIRPAVPVAESILGKSSLRLGESCRLLTYIVRAEHADGTLLYNVMTKAIVLLTKAEAAMIDMLPAGFTEAHQALADLWFIVPAESDDMALSDSLKAVVMALDSQPKPLTSYMIFTTTDCNARCFYCFEAGTRRYSMTEQTAHDVAAFIQKKCEGKPVTIRWFGGEPLLNSRVIDIICADLRKADIKYQSRMISNGYLFDEAMVQKAAREWKLKQVQITLDGTEAQYNRRKAYVHPEGSPYQRVMHNIDLLDQAGIRAHIRLNTDLSNAEDISSLCGELRDRFRGRKNISVYIAPIIENKGARPVTYDYDSRIRMRRLVDQLQQQLADEGLHSPSRLEKSLQCHYCMADSDGSTTILPNGCLGRCSNCADTETYGSIYSSEHDEAAYAKWTEHLPQQPECLSCCLYPQCIRLAHCPNQAAHCEPYMRDSIMEKLRKGLLVEYTEYWHKRPSEPDVLENPAGC